MTSTTTVIVKRKMSIFDTYDTTRSVCGRYDAPVVVLNEHVAVALLDDGKKDEVIDNDTISLQSASTDSTIPDNASILLPLYEEVSYPPCFLSQDFVKRYDLTILIMFNFNNRFEIWNSNFFLQNAKSKIVNSVRPKR